MSAPILPANQQTAPGTSMGDVLRLAWPAVVAYLLHNAFRINDQYWIKGLGDGATAAVGSAFFVIILNFSVLFLAAGGTLTLVARATGSGDLALRRSLVRHSIWLGIGIGALLCIIGSTFASEIVGLLRLEGEEAQLATQYLGTIYLWMIPLALVPVLDNTFIGKGKTAIPMSLDVLAIALNYVLNPILIYGGSAAASVSSPGVETFDAIAQSLGIEARGMTGAAVATGLSRAITVSIGVCILTWRYQTGLFGSLRARSSRFLAIARISAPVSISIAMYALVYMAIYSLVLVDLDRDVRGGLSIGFQVFEGVSFPCYMGVSMAAASLVGRSLGAGDTQAAWRAVRSSRALGRILGVLMALLFLSLGSIVVPWFTRDAGVEREALGYVSVLALSQYWVAVETVNEKVLLGAGWTRPIPWISGFCNLGRIPLAWILAVGFGFAGAGVWWAINVTTLCKAWFFWRAVQSERWLEPFDERGKAARK